MRRLFLFAALAALAPLSSSAFAADADNGENLAKRWCATCHVVAADQRSGSPDVPAFAAIANKPDFNAEKLALFLLDPHPKMPNMGLSRNEAADLAAYIAKQR
jgi:mono/diheme cytochrome c family protein